MSEASDLFTLAHQPDGSRHVLRAGATCKSCHRTDWRVMAKGGRVKSAFVNSGWLIGSKQGRHVCPGCRNQRPPPTRELTPGQKRAAWLRIEGVARREPSTDARQARKAAMLAGSSIDGMGPAILRSPDDAPLPPEPIDPSILEPANMAEALSHLGRVTATELPAPPPIDRGGLRTPHGKEVFSRGWEERHKAVRSAARYLTSLGVREPAEGVHFTIRQEPLNGDTWEWTVVEGAVTGGAPKRKSRTSVKAPGMRNRVRTAGFTTPDSARKAARSYTGAVVGRSTLEKIDFDIIQDDDGLFSWHVLPESLVKVGERLPDYVWAPRETHIKTWHGTQVRHRHESNTRQAARTFLAKCGGPAEQGVDYALDREGDLTGFRLLRVPPRLKGLIADPSIPEPQPEETPMPNDTPATVAALPPREPTRPEIRRIQDYLDANYDTKAERWKGNLSDRKAEEALNLPRAWIAAERERGFGPDVNSAPDPKWAAWQKVMADKAASLANQSMLLAEAVEALQVEIMRGPQ